MRGFTDEERARIRERLKESGRELFAKYGLQKTTIQELTEPVGIGTSTFYQFYDSKSELYRAILEEEEAEMAEHILDESFRATDDSRDAIERFLAVSFEEIESNPLLQSLLTEGEFSRVADEYSAAEKSEEYEREIALLRPHIEALQAEGDLRSGDPEVIAGLLRSVVLLTVHRDDIGPEYDAVRNLLIEVIADGLVEPED